MWSHFKDLTPVQNGLHDRYEALWLDDRDLLISFILVLLQGSWAGSYLSCFQRFDSIWTFPMLHSSNYSMLLFTVGLKTSESVYKHIMY